MSPAKVEAVPDIKFIPKSTFFDRQRVINAVSKAKRVALSHIGAFVRQRAFSLTGKRASSKRKTAAPGRPPLQHLGLLHNRIFFGYDAAHESVVIGPQKLNQRANDDTLSMLEFGGSARREDFRTHKKYTARYRGNPFMGPSLKAEIAAGTISPAWRDSVKG